MKKIVGSYPLYTVLKDEHALNSHLKNSYSNLPGQMHSTLATIGTLGKDFAFKELPFTLLKPVGL
jgi:hypothetical protein